MQTEDHPVEYGSFEGIIPRGEYGGGTVVLWDRGTWEPLGDPRKELKAGRLKFALRGEKLRGAWMLVKIRGRDPRESEKTWLLFKERDEHASPGGAYDVTAARPESVATGRTLEEIAADRDRVWHSNQPSSRKPKRLQALAARLASTSRPSPRAAAGAALPDPSSLKGARRGALPRFLPPQLATLAEEPPAGDEWLHEMKYDGYRILARKEGEQVRLLSRNDKDWTTHFPAVADAVGKLPGGALLVDGEVAVVMPDGRTSFNALQNVGSGGGALTYFLFDLLHLDGHDLAGVALQERKRLLRALVPDDGGVLRFSDHVVGRGPEFLDQASRLGLEGMVSKRRDAPYDSKRTRAWLKVKCKRAQEFVIGGFTEPEGARAGLGALVLGVYDEGRLTFVGKVGTGFTDRLARDLRRRLEALETRESPFAGKPAGIGRAHWVRPELVAEVEYTEWTKDDRLRHPSFKGLREDKEARQVAREKPVAEAAPPSPPAPASTPVPSRARRVKGRRPAEDDVAEVAGVRLTHPTRVLFPEPGVTKLDLARFYERIADWIVPHLAARPTTLVRCPEGLSEPCFYQKHTGWWAPETIRRVIIQEKRKSGEYLVVDDLPALIGLVQIGILEIHTWNSVTERLETPDRLVFDLDPGPDVGFAAVREAAVEIRERAAGLGLAGFVKTTGGKGLHVVVPLRPRAGWPECAAFARAVAEAMEADSPRRYTTDMAKARRKGRIYLDHLRNVRGATSIAAFSTRARSHAPISTPVTWKELDGLESSEDYTIANLPARLERLRTDPWKDYPKAARPLPPAVGGKTGRGRARAR
jgi:bifunctional non-homologous end joining protein LigD